MNLVALQELRETIVYNHRFKKGVIVVTAFTIISLIAIGALIHARTFSFSSLFGTVNGYCISSSLALSAIASAIFGIIYLKMKNGNRQLAEWAKLDEPLQIHSPKHLHIAKKAGQLKVLFIQEQIGKGSFTTIRRAFDLLSGVDYAHNECHSESAKRSLLVENYLHEKGVRHVLATSFGRIDDQCTCVAIYDLYEGNLKELLGKNVLTTDQKRDIILQLLETLSDFQKFGVFHRDISLENILYKKQDGQYEVVVIDFNTSEIRDMPSPFRYAIEGKPWLFSPELTKAHDLNKNGNVEAANTLIDESRDKHDIWTMGTVIGAILGINFVERPTNVTPLEELVYLMHEPDHTKRPSAIEILERFSKIH